MISADKPSPEPLIKFNKSSTVTAPLVSSVTLCAAVGENQSRRRIEYFAAAAGRELTEIRNFHRVRAGVVRIRRIVVIDDGRRTCPRP